MCARHQSGRITSRVEGIGDELDRWHMNRRRCMLERLVGLVTPRLRSFRMPIVALKVRFAGLIRTRSGHQGRKRVGWRPRQNGGSGGVCWTRKTSGGDPPSGGRRMFGVRGFEPTVQRVLFSVVRYRQTPKLPFIFPSSTSGG
jgi:hypothetical protein